MKEAPGMGTRKAGGVCSATHGFGLGVMCQAAGRVSRGDQQPDCRRGTCTAVLEHLKVPCASSSVTLRGLSGTDRVAVMICSALPHTAYSPIQGTSSTCCLRLLLTPCKGPSCTIGSPSFDCSWNGICSGCPEGELLTCASRARFEASGAQGNE